MEREASGHRLTKGAEEIGEPSEPACNEPVLVNIHSNGAGWLHGILPMIIPHLRALPTTN